MRFVLILATAILLGPIAAPAQTNNAPAQPRTVPGIPLQDPDAGDSLLDRLDRLWEGTKGLFFNDGNHKCHIPDAWRPPGR